MDGKFTLLFNTLGSEPSPPPGFEKFKLPKGLGEGPRHVDGQFITMPSMYSSSIQFSKAKVAADARYEKVLTLPA